MKNKSKILIFRLSAMGDVAMTVPVIESLVEQYPEVEVTVVSRPFFKPFFNNIPNVRFFEIDLKKRHKGFWGLLRLYKDLKSLKVDYFADFHDVLRSKVIRALFKLNGIQTASLDKGRASKKALTRIKNKIFKPVPNMFENHCNTLSKLGFKVDLSHPIFPPIPELALELLQYIGVKDSIWIGIAPFAQYNSKVYPLDLMQEVIDTLAERENVKIFLFGGGTNEIALLNLMKRDNCNVVVMAGKVKFSAELNLIQHLDLMLSMDSGNAHIAAMYGKKVITLWGGTHPYAGFAPFNQPSDYALTPDRAQYPLLPLSIYGNKMIPGYQDVMRSIPPKKVVNKIIEALTEKNK